ncbi:MAG: CRTAC1 family protein [Alcanivoracaceae bacterium]|nr:CRTAC1 family protein [Alcanivoracaceae bacterium]
MKKITLVIVVLSVLCMISCSSDTNVSSSQKNFPIKLITEKPLFIDKAKQYNLNFTYNTGSTGDLYLAEIVGGGAAFFDCDNDGDLDVLFNQGTLISRDKIYTDAQPILFRNELSIINEDRKLNFTDITEFSGITPGQYGIGVSTADVDNDGFIDFYLTVFGQNRLFHNLGNCKFTEIKNQLSDKNWSVSSSFFDLDSDGWLDLFVGNYVDHSNINNKTCRNAAGQIDYCSPKAYQPQTNSLWRNLGQLKFQNISTKSGISSSAGGALGVIASDFNGDHLIDIYVANDQFPNFLWQNKANMRFENVALINGCAVNSSGLAEASMGLDIGDIDNDGDFDIFMTHLRRETNTFFEMNEGQCLDRSNVSGLAAASVAYTGFGTGLFDMDNDSDLDVFVANGEIERISAQVLKGDPFPLKQKNQLFENTGAGQFRDISSEAGAAINLETVSRGAAFGDIDNDGDTDILVINSNAAAQLLINTKGQDKNWIGFDIYEDKLNRHAIGAVVEIEMTDGSKRIKRVATDGSYAVANDPRVIFGLDGDISINRVKVYWLDGNFSEYHNLKSGKYYKILRNGSSVTEL